MMIHDCTTKYHPKSTSLVTLTGLCPSCGHTLKLCQTKGGVLFIGCSAFPRCDFRAPYDPVLQTLRDRAARLDAELTLLKMQQTPPTLEANQQPRSTMADAVRARQRALRTWAAIAQRWGGTLREGRV